MLASVAMNSHDHWKHDGVRVIPADRLDPNTAQTPGMDRRRPSISPASALASCGPERCTSMRMPRRAPTTTGRVDKVIYIVRGRARMRWGRAARVHRRGGAGRLHLCAAVPAPHQEINASPTETLECVLVQQRWEAVAINLDIEPVEKPESVPWVDPTHPKGGV